MPENVLKILKKRGFIEWCSHEEELSNLFETEMVTGYVGFDPTSSSLHVGNLIPIMGLAWLQRCGHRPIAIVGGGTGMIGDPSGKTKERELLSLEQIEQNLQGIKSQLEKFLDFDCGKNSALIINNYDWLGKLKLIEFLRDIGKNFTVNYMISKEYVKSRLSDPDKGISYTEFSYMLLQAYDFYHLYKEYNCKIQFGGNDQQGNITAGIELIRKKLGAQAYGCTYPLLLTAEGKKFGKTEEGNVWLSPQRTSPYKFYQFWINADDRDVKRLLLYFTFLPEEEIEEIIHQHQQKPENRIAQKRLAWEVTVLVHGKDIAKNVKEASEILFSGDRTKVPEPAVLDILEKEIPMGSYSLGLPAKITDVLANSGVCKSKAEVRRLISGGGLFVNGKKIETPDEEITYDKLLEGKRLFVRTGKKKFFIVKVE